MDNKVCLKCGLRKAITNFKKPTDLECVVCKPKRKKKSNKED